MDNIISAIIGGAFSLIVCTITNVVQHRKTMALMEYKLDQLTHRVDKHNNVIERTYELERQSALQAEKISVINHRIKDIEELERRENHE